MSPFPRHIMAFAIGLFLMGVLFSSLFAQQTGEIKGKVTDEEGSPLAGVSITAKSPSLQGLRSAGTDINGNFRFPLLPVGKYALIFELSGFEKLTTTDNEVRLGFTTSTTVVLRIAKISQEVTVTATNPLIDKVNADNSYRLKGEDLAKVPTQARTVEEVISYTPGVTGVRASMVRGTGTGRPSFRGEGDAGNNWLVDGLSMKGAQANDLAVEINYDAWEEVQIISDGFAPNLGQSMGGFINIVTKSGSNDFHGEMGGLIRDWHLRAEQKPQLSLVSVTDTSRHQFFGNLGGPLLKDKLWFFISDNLDWTLDDSEPHSIGWLNIPAGKRRLSTNNIFGKLTFTPHKNHTISLAGTLDKFLNQTGGVGLLETYEKTDYANFSYRINYRGILSHNILLTAVWGQYRRRSNTEPLDGDYGPPSYFWQDIGQSTNNSAGYQLNIERRSDFTLEITHYLDLGSWGSHEARAGFSYYRNYYEQDVRCTGRDLDPWPGNGFDNGVSITWTAPGIPSSLAERGPEGFDNASGGLGFSIEDKFTLGRFALMLGLRAETQKVFNDLGQTIWSWRFGDFLCLRASLTIDLLGDGHNIFKLGYGQFANPQTTTWLQWFNRGSSGGFRAYYWIGTANPTADQLKDPLNWNFAWEMSGIATPMEVDPGLKPNKTSKFLLEFDRQLATNWVLKLRGIYSYSRNLTDDIGLYNPETLISYFFTNFELKRRDYRAIEVELDGRIGEKFVLNASYTWSQSKGTNPGNSGEYPTWSYPGGQGAYDAGLFGDHAYMPEGEPAKDLIDALFQGLGGRSIGDEGWYGFLPYSVDHMIKILGTYIAPYGFHASVGIEYLSGYHWEKKGYSLGYGCYCTFPEGRGERTTPAHMYVDLAIEKDFILRKGLVFGLGLNVYNLLNSQKPISYIKEDSELFGEVWGRQLPRWLQFKMTIKF